MQIADIHLLFDHYYWATTRILEATGQITEDQLIQKHNQAGRSLRAILVHTMSSERNWRSIWTGNRPPEDLSEEAFHDLDAIRWYWKQLEKGMQSYLAGIQTEDLLSTIKGITDGGTPYVDLTWHSMMHVLFHGSQHRSEAATLLAEYGHSPGELDFFVFLRQQGSQQAWRWQEDHR